VSGSDLLGYLNEAFMLSSAASLIVGWWRIRHGRVHGHRRAMLTTAALAAGFFLSYVAKSLAYGDTSFGGPARLAPFYQGFLQVHVVLATVAAVLGVVTLRWAFRRRFHRHRRLAPWTAAMWLVAAGSGLAVFLLLYVVYPPGATHNVVRTIIGAGG
jgi:putative membrane protein